MRMLSLWSLREYILLRLISTRICVHHLRSLSSTMHHLPSSLRARWHSASASVVVSSDYSIWRLSRSVYIASSIWMSSLLYLTYHTILQQLRARSLRCITHRVFQRLPRWQRLRNHISSHRLSLRLISLVTCLSYVSTSVA